MCTLIVLHRCVAGRPLVVAANRDEFLDRPAEDFALRASRRGPILSPLDREAGGTWVGLNPQGLFAGLTNLRTDAEASEPNKNLKSRGGVVMSALEAGSARDAASMLLELEEAAYNPFQLLVADGRDAFLVVYRERPRLNALEPGPHVVGNVEDDRIESVISSNLGDGRVGDRLNPLHPGRDDANQLEENEEPRALKLTRIRAGVEKLVMEPRQDLFEGLARICREHVHVDGHQDDGSKDTHGEERGAASPFESTCVHFADRYGTRSSLLLELSENPDASRLWTTDGPPCERPFDNRSSLLSDLGVRLGS